MIRTASLGLALLLVSGAALAAAADPGGDRSILDTRASRDVAAQPARPETRASRAWRERYREGVRIPFVTERLGWRVVPRAMPADDSRERYR